MSQLPIAAIAAAALLAASPAAQRAVGLQQEKSAVIYYDYLEDGVLRGGVIPVDPQNPWHATAGEPPLPRAGTAVTTVIDNGPPSNRIDLVFVGDGYTAAQLGTYAAHVDAILPPFFAEAPLAAYESFFNVHRVDVVSNESGVDHDPNFGVMKDTALHMGYWCSNIERLLCVHTGWARSFASLAPDDDQILAVANSSKYGGAGYPSSDLCTLAGNNSAAIEIALHEFGHSFADLADEYDYGGPTNYNGGEPSEKNVSIYQSAQMLSEQRKWFRWLDLPNVGTFEGAKYSQFGIYRPTNNSLMRNLYRPFEQVNTERMLAWIYQYVDPIDDASPAEGPYGASSVLFVDPVDPLDHALSIQWSLDGSPIPGATGETLDLSTVTIPSGPHLVTVRVVDETALVRDEALRDARLTEERSWTVHGEGDVLPYGCGQNPAGSLEVLSGRPAIGTTMVLGVDDPSGRVPVGSIAGLMRSGAPHANYPCGMPIGGAGPGELLLNRRRMTLPNLDGGPWSGAGSPVPIDLEIPDDPSLLGTSIFVQGILIDGSRAPRLSIGLTEAAQLRIGF